MEEAEVLPLVGELTETPAKAGTAKAANRQNKSNDLPECILNISQLMFVLLKSREKAATSR
jgi:hypothetical protein